MDPSPLLDVCRRSLGCLLHICTKVLFGLNVFINQKEIEYFYFAIHKLVSTEDHPFSGHTNIICKFSQNLPLISAVHVRLGD